MTDYVVRDTSITPIADAIRSRGGTSEPMEFPNGFVRAIGAIKAVDDAVADKPVLFIDYDGWPICGYTAEAFLALDALPENPRHAGLTAQGWNWTLEAAQAHVRKYGRLEVGQMYTTTDGKTRLYIRLQENRTSPMMGLKVNGTVDVDWGDGTAHDTLTGSSLSTMQWTPTHSYAAPGDYVIQLTVTGSMSFGGSSQSNQNSAALRFTSTGDTRNYTYQGAISRVEVGDGVTALDDYAFAYCFSLNSISIPRTVAKIGGAAFQSCYRLPGITIPKGLTQLGASSFTSSYSLCRIALPEGLLSLPVNAFSSSYSLARVTIPDSVTILEGSAFANCYNLLHIDIPDGVTTVKNGAFNGCRKLTRMRCPASVTRIEMYAFNNCPGVLEYHFEPVNPPTLTYKDIFMNISDDCLIYVPAGSVEAYKQAQYWSSLADRIVAATCTSPPPPSPQGTPSLPEPTAFSPTLPTR